MQERRHPTLRVLALPDVRSYLTARLCGVMARMVLHAAVVWHLFEATREEFWLGVLGAVEFLPVIPVAFVGGALADSRDRRDVMCWAQVASGLGAAVLWWGTGGHGNVVVWILASLFCVRVAWGFEFPASQAMLPALVPREIFQNAVVVSATVRNLAFVSGPVLAGFAIDAWGARSAYALSALFYAGSVLALLRVRRIGVRAEGTRIGVRAVREGLGFLRRQPAILAAMTLDMVAVILADPTVLLAVFAQEILAVGPRGYGLLYASVAIGTLSMTLLLLFRQPFERPGRALLLSVLGFGLAATVFGASRWFPFSVAALVAAGMADQVSQVARSTIIQLSTPDALRGRVSAVNMVFISASNEFGAAFSGFLAAATSASFAVVAGGLACLGCVGVTSAATPSLRRWSEEGDVAVP